MIDIKYLLLIFFALLATQQVNAQKSRAELEKEKKENIQKIEQAEKILNQTTSKKKATLGQLNALNFKIEAQQSITNSISNEIGLLDQQVNEIGGIISSLEQDLEKMKKEYASMLYATQKSNQSLSKLSYIFASASFYQMFMRLKHMEYYAKVRRNQAEQIEAIKVLLTDQQESVEQIRLDKSVLLQEQINRNRELNRLKAEQSNVVAQLSKREKEVKEEIEERKSAVKNLEKVIAELIKKEIEKSSKGASSTKFALTPEAKELSSSFAGNQSKLFWPVAAGFISQKFGTHPHSVYKNISINNDGIDIQTNENEEVRAVFDGEVKYVAFVPSMNNVVMVQHGEYFTVYAKLKSVNVKKGDKIVAKQSLGTVYTNNEGTSEIQFQVWKNNQKLNPEAWLFKK
ncbi:peptidoglycan DD-metalloendopeptidase family protein [Marivirga sp. S37H4]|uniref:Peptidoglycan DD-metalloendopeptidase family protein n=1 Tax=Marivirga aurantiaca TaxID=2802615 RepID=A0A934WYF3_9BACT|nr:peptidoglycan DD-metalloendopeptidase family protein [Marivirga aurantiaca]MBK6265177.1 peptidoglycan DD-metalloendopeptidase family protein [Marivirga aurantiaca]